MSAIAEPTEAVKQEAVVAQPPKVQTFTLDSVLKKASQLSAKGTLPVEEPPKTEPVKESDKTEDKKEEKKEDQQVKEPVKESDKTDGKTPEIKHNAQHFKVVTDARDAALARVKALETELETAKKTPPPEISTKLTDYEKELAELRKANGDYQARIREIDIAQDPEFQRNYDQKITSGMEEVLGYLTASGTDKAEATALVKNWDLRGISDAAADMDEVSKGLMMSAIRETQRVANERTAQLKKPEDFASKRRLQMEEQQKQAVQQRQTIAEKIMNGLLESTPALKEEMYADFRTKVQNQLGRAARGEMPPNEVMAMVAQAEALQMGLAGQHAALEEMSKENEELKKKVAEQEEFIKNASGSLKSGTGQAPAADENKPIWERVKVIHPG